MLLLKLSSFICSCVFILELHTVSAENFLEKLDSYDPRIAPVESPGHPIKVNVSMYILDVVRVDDMNQEIGTQMYLRQAWRDLRLRQESRSALHRHLLFSDLDKIWHPDLFIVDESRGRMNAIPFPNSFIRWGPEGEMLMSMRLTMTTRCRMDFTYFPHDQHACMFSIESYGYTADQVSLHWDKQRGPVGISDPVQVNNFGVVKLEQQSVEKVELSFGNYSRLPLKLTIARKPGFYITKIYIPYILLTCVSFLSLWINPKLMLARLSLPLTVLLIMFALASNIQTHVPRVTYTMALDVWLAFCTTIVFSVFLEFIIVLMTLKLRKNSEDLIEATLEMETAEKDGKESISRKLFPFPANIFRSKLQQGTSRLDNASRFVFPFVFVAFNILYWAIYVS